ncbi:TetR/AcrR family transcriptional regulator [Kocuria rhizophila]|uniref:TetR/AcrR family transcriptional regulator n=1 Tax=Kocuria rhizophila TaxID=72000 RepID=UPI00190B7F37|nr:TetR/AcrR family transcriptional regulator [Kocuria rhizophila]MBK4121311.1 TetR family transcriptional regulator [Kocuria rhizophila]
MSEASAVTEDVVTRSIRMLADHGYMETTVEQLAQAAGISRATFFRKYGSKEDVVFADHAATLERLEALLQRPGLSPQDGLVEGAQLVFRHNLDHAQRAFARHDLLQRVESLRDREIAMSSRYERVFHAFLRAALPDSPDRRVTAVALPAATVAVHNAFLRTWLRGPRPGQGEQLAAALSRRVGWLCALFGVTHQETAPSGSPADLSFSSAQVSLELDDAAASEAAPPESSASALGAAGVAAARGRDSVAVPEGSVAGSAEDGEPALAGPRGGVVDGSRADVGSASHGDAPIVVLVPRGGDPADVAERTARSVYEALRG